MNYLSKFFEWITIIFLILVGLVFLAMGLWMLLSIPFIKGLTFAILGAFSLFIGIMVYME